MTRKRFIKLQMAAGCDRNTAAAIAQRVQVSGMSYAESQAKWTAARGFAASLTAGLVDTLAPVVGAVTTWVKAVAAGYEAFSKALTDGGLKDES